MAFQDFETNEEAIKFMDEKDKELSESFHLTLRKVWRVEWWDK